MTIRLPKHFCKFGCLIFLLLCLPFLLDGEQGRPLPLANDMFLPNFVAMEKGPETEAFAVAIHVEQPEKLADLQWITMKFGTYFKTVPIQSAELMQEGGTCRLALAAPQQLADGGTLELTGEPCPWLKTQEFTLKVWGQMDGIALLGYEGLSETQSNPRIFATNQQGVSLALAGSFLPRQTQVQEYWPRVRMLAYMWNWADHWQVFAGILAAALVLVALGCAYFLGLLIQGTPQNSLASCIAAVLLLFALHVCYAFLSPPFQAPDESDHFLTFSRNGELHRAETEGLALANASHFDRLMCHVNEKFTKADLNRPMTMERWNPFHVSHVDVPSRSALAHVLWPLIARAFFDENSAPETVHLGLRIFNGFYFACIFALTLLIYRRFENFAVPDALLALLLVPTLLHFSNHNSNHAFLISHYLPFILAFRPIVTGRPLTRFACFWIGLNLGLCFLAGRLGLIFLLVSYGGFVLRWIVMGAKTESLDARPIRHSMIDFAALALPLGALILGARQSTYLSTQLASWQSLTDISGLFFLTFLAMAVAAPLLAFGLGALMRQKPVIFGIKGAAWLVACLLIGLLVLPLFKEFPPMINIEYLNPHLTGWQYTRKVLKHFVLSWGWWGQDFYLVESFWGGFGCPEPVVGNTVVQLIKGSLATITTLGFIRGIRWGDWRFSLMLMSCFVLLLLNLAALAYGSAAQPSNLHGRYMVGFYLLLIQVAILSWQERKDAKIGPIYLNMGPMLAMALVQIASVWYLLGRYF